MTVYAYVSLVVFLSLQFGQWCHGFNCVKVNSCKCRLDDGTFIDLSPIGLQNGEPRFKNLPDAGIGDFWSYNPCYSFTENACNDVAACQIRNGAGFNAGVQDSAKFQYDETNGMALVYSATTEGVLRTTYTYLQCDNAKEGELTVLGELVPDGNYYLYLASKYACPRDDTSEGSGLSGGSILLIIALVIVLVYFGGGFIFLTFIRKAGGADRVPNVSFWILLPGLIKDGVLYSVQSLKGRAGYSST